MVNASSVANLIRRIPSAFVLLVGLLGAILSILGVFWNWSALTGGALAATIFIAQYSTQGNVTVKFAECDWRKDINDSFWFSAGRYHGKGRKPNVSVYLPTDDGGYEEVMCDVRTLRSGEVVIGASEPYDGEVRIS